jgi:hypothetical protein
MSKSTWTGAVSSDWADPDNWSPAGVPSSSSDVTIATGRAIASASIGTVNSIKDSSGLRFRSAGTNTVATFLDNGGQLRLDRKGGAGGTILNIGRTLTNRGSLRIGNATLSAPDVVTAASLGNTGEIRLLGSAANQALLDVSGSAGFGTAGALSGDVQLTGDSAIEFKSGQITGLAADGRLRRNGSDAFIEDSTALGSNSALTGLASIGRQASLILANGASVSTTGALVNDGLAYIDVFGGEGGSSLTLAGALTNSDLLKIGNNALSASDEVTTASLDNRGSIVLTGSGANQALLDVTGSAGFGAAGVLSGFVELAGDSAIEFKSGHITSLAPNAGLFLNGNDAFIEDSTSLGSNSALTGLASIGSQATLELENEAAVSTTGAFVNHGRINLDANDGDGGSTLSIGGALTNSGYLLIGNTTGGLSASSTVTAASLNNTGSILLDSFGAPALLDVTAGSAGFGAAGVLSGSVKLVGDSAIEFKSGQISTIATDAYLLLLGNAFIEDSTALGSNSALTGLANVAGDLDLERTAAVSTTGALVNNESILLDFYAGEGGSRLTVAGTLTNTGTLFIGSNGNFLSASDSVTANSFVNSGTVDLIGNGTNLAALNVSGATTNNGSIVIDGDTEELAGAVGGAGSFNLSNAHLRFDSSVSAGQTITETGKNALILGQAQKFAGTIKGFGTGDTIDAANFLFSGTTFAFVENPAGTFGTLVLLDGGLTANIQMSGVHKLSDFSFAPDSGTGTLVKFV